MSKRLLAHSLVDRMHVWTFPVAVGAGMRLFASGSRAKNWMLVDSHISPMGVIVATYEPAGELNVGSFGG